MLLGVIDAMFSWYSNTQTTFLLMDIVGDALWMVASVGKAFVKALSFRSQT